MAYFSHSGNTRVIANQIHESVGGDIFEIVAVDPYPRNYHEVVEQERKELREGYRPKLETKVENMESLDVVFIGYPNWWDTIPMPVAAFLSENDFSGKTIVPVCTNVGNRLGETLRISPSFARNQPFWMVLQSGAETQKKLRRMRYTCGCVNLK